jgi:hypothetical protein
LVDKIRETEDSIGKEHSQTKNDIVGLSEVEKAKRLPRRVRSRCIH